MARMLFDPPNFLVLDEPTNHLDLATKEMLVEALKDFEGTMIFVSHDRIFLRGPQQPRARAGRRERHRCHSPTSIPARTSSTSSAPATRRLASTASILLLVLYLFAQPPPVPRTLRVDYFHTGNTKQELFSLDEAVIEPAPWPGTTAAEDGLRYGTYGFDVRDAARRTLLYSRGFGSIYDEWVTTEEAGPSRGRSTSRCDSRCRRRRSRSRSASANPATSGATCGRCRSIRRTCSSTPRRRSRHRGR